MKRFSIEKYPIITTKIQESELESEKNEYIVEYPEYLTKNPEFDKLQYKRVEHFHKHYK
jgi:hypothetical protein